LEADALEELVKLGAEKSLRYATQLLSPALLYAKQNGREKVSREDVAEVSRLFISTAESSSYLKELEEKMLR
ncbi:MAG: TATA box-binding protein, partial [Infirmifilum sp.]